MINIIFMSCNLLYCNVIKNYLFAETTNMAPFRWPETRYDIALAIEVSASNPVKPKDWEAIAERLSTAFSTDTNNVQLKGKGCRERMERLVDKYKEEDARALKRLAVYFLGGNNFWAFRHVDFLLCCHLDLGLRRNTLN